MQDNGNCDLCEKEGDCKESEELKPMGNQIEKIQEGNSKPEDLPSKDFEEVGKNAIEVFGYNRLVSSGGDSGLVDPSKKASPEPVQAKMQNNSDVVIQRNAATIARGAFTAAGVISQLDSPLPGPADLAALGVLAVGLLAAGVVYMASRGSG